MFMSQSLSGVPTASILRFMLCIAIRKFTYCTALLHENAQFCSDKKCLI